MLRIRTGPSLRTAVIVGVRATLAVCGTRAPGDTSGDRSETASRDLRRETVSSTSQPFEVWGGKKPGAVGAQDFHSGTPGSDCS